MYMKSVNEKITNHYLSTRLNENLSLLLGTSKIAVSKLHENTKIPKATIKRLQKDPKANPTISTLLPIANYFKISINQLIGNDPLPNELNSHLENRYNLLEIPLIKWKDIPNWPNKNIRIWGKVLTGARIDNNSFALSLDNNEYTNFLPNTVLVINTSVKTKHRDLVIILKEGKTIASLNQLIIHDGDYFFIPINFDLRATPLTKQYKIIGVVVQARSDLRAVNTITNQ